jgi:hypothetical protein
MIVKFLTSSYEWILVFVLLGNFCQNLTFSKDSCCAGVANQNTQIGRKSGSGWFPTPRFPSPDLESRVELWKLGKPWWEGLARNVNIWWASQFRGGLWVWNTERRHGRPKNWALCHWAWLGGANSLEDQVCPCVLRMKEKRLRAFVSVKHELRAWQTKELVRKEPYA